MSLSARSLALIANTACPRLDTLAHHGVADTAAAKAYGYTTKQPRLAYALGKAYERRITDDKPRLFELTHAPESQVVEIEEELADTDVWERTSAALNNPQVGMVLQGAVPGLAGGWLRPDIMVRNAGGWWEVGEIKIYLDKGGLTDAGSVQAALTQAAAAVVSLRKHASVPVSSTAHLLLTNLRGAPVSYRADISGEAARLGIALERIAYAGEVTGVPDVADTEHVYSKACIGKCALADYCRQSLQGQGQVFPSEGFTSGSGVTERDLLQGQWAAYAQSLIASE